MKIIISEKEVNEIIDIIQIIDSPELSQMYREIFIKERDDVFVNNQLRIIVINVKLSSLMRIIAKNTITINKYLKRGFSITDINGYRKLLKDIYHEYRRA